jgi:hypothetical protein
MSSLLYMPYRNAWLRLFASAATSVSVLEVIINITPPAIMERSWTSADKTWISNTQEIIGIIMHPSAM